MFKVTFLQNGSKLPNGNLSPIQDSSYNEILSFNWKHGGEDAAEKLWHYTNAPEECLTLAEFRLVEKLSCTFNWNGPSMCIGDVAWVVDSKTGAEQFWLCELYGWKQIENFIQTIKDIFLFV